jgi:hypothetical protein
MGLTEPRRERGASLLSKGTGVGGYARRIRGEVFRKDMSITNVGF